MTGHYDEELSTKKDLSNFRKIKFWKRLLSILKVVNNKKLTHLNNTENCFIL